jgi:hypothetical protein
MLGSKPLGSNFGAIDEQLLGAVAYCCQELLLHLEGLHRLPSIVHRQVERAGLLGPGLSGLESSNERLHVPSLQHSFPTPHQHHRHLQINKRLHWKYFGGIP